MDLLVGYFLGVVFAFELAGVQLSPYFLNELVLLVEFGSESVF